MRRFVVEIGMGVDLHGQDVTKAAERAVRDAVERVSLPGLREVGGMTDAAAEMLVEVTLGVPDLDRHPEAVTAIDHGRVLAVLPYGRKTLRIRPGGLRVDSGLVLPDQGDTTSGDAIVVVAAVSVGLAD